VGPLTNMMKNMVYPTVLIVAKVGVMGHHHGCSWQVCPFNVTTLQNKKYGDTGESVGAEECFAVDEMCISTLLAVGKTSASKDGLVMVEINFTCDQCRINDMYKHGHGILHNLIYLLLL